MVPTIDVAAAIARESGVLLREGFGRKRQLDFKSRAELVTDMDLASERLIVERIAAHYPDHQIITEEGGGREEQSRFVWLVDPLDGTNNYAHGNPFFTVSIALLEDNELQLGVVYAPMQDECFTAVRGGPALLNDKSVQVSEITELRYAQVSTGFPYSRWTDGVTNVPETAEMIMRCQDVRRMGSAALDLCYVAAGRHDAHWELVLKPWDSAAGALIVMMAGGQVSSCAGEPYTPFEGGIVAANPGLHGAIVGVLAEAGRQ